MHITKTPTHYKAHTFIVDLNVSVNKVINNESVTTAAKQYVL